MRCLTLEAHWLGCTTNASLAMPEKANMICPFLNFCMLRRHVIFLWLEQEITQFSSVSKIVQQDATMYSLLYFCKLLYMFRVVTPPIIRSTYSCNYSIWHWSNFGKCSVWSQLKMRGMDTDGSVPLICLHCIYVFCSYLRTNSDLCHLQHKLIGFYNRDEKCLLRGTNWVFK